MFLTLTVNFLGLEHYCALELYKKVNENLVFFSRYFKGLSRYPEHSCHSIGNQGQTMEILNITFNVLNFLRKQPRKPQLSPWSPFLIFVNYGKLNYFGNGRIAIFRKLNRFILSHLLYLEESVVWNCINKRMIAKVNEEE